MSPMIGRRGPQGGRARPPMSPESYGDWRSGLQLDGIHGADSDRHPSGRRIACCPVADRRIAVVATALVESLRRVICVHAVVPLTQPIPTSHAPDISDG